MSIGIIGVPTSAGAFAPGQEQAPAALRAAGLVEALERQGLEVNDRGDREVWRWRPDRDNPRAQNAGKVVEIVEDTASRISESAGGGEVSLVLGGDCTVGIGTVAAHSAGDARVGLIYFDAHADLNVPASVHEGALDWMGMAHMLGEDGAIPELAEAGSRSPMLESEQVLLFAWDREQSTEFERDAIERRGCAVVPAGDVAADPEGAAARGLAAMDARCDRLLVHFDVDAIDFTDTPLSENWGRNEGIPYEAAIRALAVFLATPSLAALTVTELNPDHVEEGAHTLERFTSDLASSVGGGQRRRR
jgi:arginase